MNLNSKIGLGTVQFGTDYGISNKQGQTAASEVKNILEAAIDAGISMLDTASAYGNAEEILGKNNLNDFSIVSKFMPSKGFLSLSDQLTQTLNRLQVDSIHAYIAHKPNELLQNKSDWSAMKEFKEAGLIKKLGYSLYAVDELTRLMDAGFVPDLVQVPFNYLDHRFEEQLKQLKTYGCEVHTRSSFLQGLFFLKANQLPPFFDEIKDVIRDLQVEYKTSLASTLLQHVLNQEFIDCVIIGVENVQQLNSNLEGLGEFRSLPSINKNISDKILIPSNWPQ